MMIISLAIERPSRTLIPFLFFPFLLSLPFLEGCTKSKSDTPVTYCFDNYSMNSEWKDEAPLVINGYTSNANEPRIYPDSNTLFFNDKPAAGDSAMQIHWASRDGNDSTGLTWTYGGELTGVNSNTALDGTPAVWFDSAHQLLHFFFVSTRSYNGTSEFGMIYGGDLTVSGSAPFLSMNATPSLRDTAIQIKEGGHLDMDVDVAFDGSQMIVSRAVFSGAGLPDLSSLAFFSMDSSGQAVTDSQASSLLTAVNDSLCRVYAGNLSDDKLELYYSAFGIRKGAVEFHVLVSKRNSTTSAFSQGQIISAIAGDVTEGPSISKDGQTLYYHKKKPDGSVGIYRVLRTL
jgi:hypothetical protein